MGRKYNSAAIDLVWKRARNKARRLTRGRTRGGFFGYYVGSSRQQRKANQRRDRADWFDAILCDAVWSSTVQGVAK